MGMIVTLYLISANVYNSVDAPASRGFSNIEVWMIGSQLPILASVIEYGYILYLKKSRKISTESIKKLDYITLVVSLSMFVTFVVIYWTVFIV